MEALLKLALFIGIFMVIHYVSNSDRFNSYDDTDDKANKERSGLRLYIDNRTGLHYIKGGIFSNMIPRLDVDGKQIREVR